MSSSSADQDTQINLNLSEDRERLIEMINGLVQDPDPAMQALAIVPGDWDRIHDAFCVFCGAHPDNRSDMLDRELHAIIARHFDAAFPECAYEADERFRLVCEIITDQQAEAARTVEEDTPTHLTPGGFMLTAMIMYLIGYDPRLDENGVRHRQLQYDEISYLQSFYPTVSRYDFTTNYLGTLSSTTEYAYELLIDQIEYAGEESVYEDMLTADQLRQVRVLRNRLMREEMEADREADAQEPQGL